ncbi:hypothetical protein SH449x_004396 [Pirellulaceae bacterium SH449]
MHRGTAKSRERILWILGFLLIGALGCSSAPKVADSDPAKAKEVATTILESWKSGGTMDSLQKQSPPIYAVIDLWKNGHTLDSYEIIGDGEMLGPNVRLQVRFQCQDKAGKKVDRTINYLVTTTPAITFIKEDG